MRGGVRTGVDLLDRALGGIAPGLPLVVRGAQGTGRTAICLALAEAARRRGDGVVWLTGEPPELVIRQAESLGFDWGEFLSDGGLALLELEANAPSVLRMRGEAALAEAIRAEQAGPQLLVVEAVERLAGEIYDEGRLRAFLAALTAIPAGEKRLTVVTADPEGEGPVRRLLSERAGTVVELERGPDCRVLRVIKSLAGASPCDEIGFEVTESGLRAVTPASARAARAAAPTAGPARVLVVDPSPEERAHVREVLGETHEVVEACDGFEALSKLLETRPSLVLLEPHLPGVDGHKLLRAIHGSGASLPVLVLSGHVGRKGDRVRLLYLGAQDVVSKPVHPDELRHRVRTLLAMQLDDTSCLDGRSAGDLLRDGGKRVLDSGAFDEVLDRAARLGERFQFASTVIGVEADTPEQLEAFLVLSDQVLRADDRLLALDEHRALMLLPLTDPSQSTVALLRLRARLEQAGDFGDGLRHSVFDQRRFRELTSPKECFEELAPLPTGEIP